jgi:predicted AAA+ superfamily ATPase
MHYLQRISSVDRVLSHAGTGYAFEGFITEEMLQGLNAASVSCWSSNYYRTRGGREVDLVLTSPDGAMIPVEIKFGASTRREEIKPLAAFIEQEKLAYGILINNSERLALLAHNIIQIPAGYL